MEPFGDVRDDYRHAIGSAGIMSMLTSGEPIPPRALLPIKPPVDPEFEAKLRRARIHAAMMNKAR